MEALRSDMSVPVRLSSERWAIPVCPRLPRRGPSTCLCQRRLLAMAGSRRPAAAGACLEAGLETVNGLLALGTGLAPDNAASGVSNLMRNALLCGLTMPVRPTLVSLRDGRTANPPLHADPKWSQLLAFPQPPARSPTSEDRRVAKECS